MSYVPATPKRATTTASRRRPGTRPPTDRQLADLPRWLEKIKTLPDIRWGKVAAIRAALASGQYDADARLEDLLDKLPADLGALKDRER